MANRKITRVEKLHNEYNLIKQYYRQFQNGLLSEEQYNAKKTQTLEEMTKVFEEKGKRRIKSVYYKNDTFILLSMLCSLIHAITKEEFYYYTRNL